MQEFITPLKCSIIEMLIPARSRSTHHVLAGGALTRARMPSQCHGHVSIWSKMSIMHRYYMHCRYPYACYWPALAVLVLSLLSICLSPAGLPIETSIVAAGLSRDWCVMAVSSYDRTRKCWTERDLPRLKTAVEYVRGRYILFCSISRCIDRLFNQWS